MQEISLDRAKNFAASGRFHVPTVINQSCPECKRLCAFQGSAWHPLNGLKLVGSEHWCPNCKTMIRFFVLDPKMVTANATEEDMRPPRLFMDPPMKSHHEALSGKDALPETVQRAYTSAVNVFNCREWNAAAVMAGRTLEALCKSIIGSNMKPNADLNQMLNELPNHFDAQQPLQELVHALRKGRNLGAHFDDMKEVDEETAKLIMEFLDYFIEFVFILPDRVHKFAEKM